MIIILKKDGTVVTDDGNPIEGVKLDNAAAILADPKDGDSIVYDATAGMWVAGTGGGSFEPDITNPQDGDTLVYDASEEKWVNGSGGSGGGFLKVVANSETGAFDKTWNEIKTAIENGYYVSVVGNLPPDAPAEWSQTQIARCTNADGSYNVYAFWVDSNGSGEVTYTTNSSDGYPEPGD